MDQQSSDNCDPVMVESLVTAAANGMQRACIPDITTNSEMISAAFTLLDRTLRNVRKHQPPTDRFFVAAQIKEALHELLLDHGSVPN